MDHATRINFLMELQTRLTTAVSAVELIAATRPSELPGIVRTLSASELRVGEGLLPSPIPRVTLSLDSPMDAQALCAAWRISRPVAVSGDVRQRSWRIFIAGEELPDPHSRRIAVTPVTAGRWEVALRLAGRPAGALPDVVAGASPAYDLLDRDAEITRIEVTPAATRLAVVSGAHPDARALLESMASRYPAWRAGWTVSPDIEFAVVYRREHPVAGAALKRDGHGRSAASRFCVIPDSHIRHAGSALLNVLEAAALDHGSQRLTLDDSVFLHEATIPYRRHGYAVTPAYGGDADAAMWVERDITLDLE
jgi:hypothetical protein